MLAYDSWFVISNLKIVTSHKIVLPQEVKAGLGSFFSCLLIFFSLSGNYVGSNPVNQGSLTILGLHLTMAPFTKISFFTDKKEVQRSASALGYVAHVCYFSLLNYYICC